MPKHLIRRISCVFLAIGFLAVPPTFAHHIKQGATKTMPVTTSSAKARDLYERGMQDYENLYLERANVGWRAAVEADPNFALAYVWLAFNGRDPEESKGARDKAKALVAKVTPGERLMIEWVTNVQENNFLAGISAMNDMLEMYPKDKRLVFLAGNWMMGESGYEAAQKQFERALTIDKNYPAALNDLGYCYARDRQFDKAFAAMDRYVALLPKEPNPQDSYGELMRMAGNFDGSLEHYRAALKIDSEFVSSQLGVADTYAVMGEEAKARPEYDKAIQQSRTNADRLDFGLQQATTWVREGKFDEADSAFNLLAVKAHAWGLDLEAAQAYRMMSMYQPDDAVALKHLESAESALNPTASMSEADREEERSRILRWRAIRAAHSGNQELADKAMHQLESMAGASRSESVQNSYHAAAGALLVMKGKFAEAIPHLQDDTEDACSMDLLSRAFSETEDSDSMHDVEVRLRGTNDPSMEQALTVPAARARKPGTR